MNNDKDKKYKEQLERSKKMQILLNEMQELRAFRNYVRRSKKMSKEIKAMHNKTADMRERECVESMGRLLGLFDFSEN